MAASQNQRLRRLAEKASRRKLIVAEKRKAEAAIAGGRDLRQIGEAALSPVRTCVVSAGLFDDGIGWLVLARTLRSGLIGASFFLVDVWCLGVKDAFFSVLSRPAFEERIADTRQTQALVDIDPSVARKLLQDAVAYADSFGFAPNAGFAAAQAIFGDIEPATQTFTFGRDGKPFFTSGPNDTRARIRGILDTLEKSAGPGGYDYLVLAGGVG